MRLLAILMMSVLMGISAVAGDIRAIVDDTPISDFDVEARAKMLMLQQAGRVGKLTDELRREALRDLIDERIRIQAAHKQNLQASEEDIQNALMHLEAQNGLPAGGFKKMMDEQGVPYRTLINQTAANLSWLRVMQKSGRAVQVSDAEIKARKDVIRKDLSRDSISFAEIIVATEEEALTLWQQLQSGSDFATLVELHSIADSRLSGGRVMGVPLDYYGTTVADVLREMQIGQLSRPIQVKKGYALILMLDKREAVTGDTVTVWELAQVVVPADSVANTLLQKTNIKNGCEEFAELVKDDAIAGSFQLGRVSPTQLPGDVAPMLKAADFKKVIGPLTIPPGMLYFMKCGSEERRVMPSDEELRMQLEAEKMELLSKQLLSELKRDVVVEYK